MFSFNDVQRMCRAIPTIYCIYTMHGYIIFTDRDICVKVKNQPDKLAPQAAVPWIKAFAATCRDASMAISLEHDEYNEVTWTCFTVPLMEATRHAALAILRFGGLIIGELRHWVTIANVAPYLMRAKALRGDACVTVAHAECTLMFSVYSPLVCHGSVEKVGGSSNKEYNERDAAAFRHTAAEMGLILDGDDLHVYIDDSFEYVHTFVTRVFTRLGAEHVDVTVNFQQAVKFDARGQCLLPELETVASIEAMCMGFNDFPHALSLS